MKDPRASKRRRVSDIQNTDGDGDTTMRDEAQNAPASPLAEEAKAESSATEEPKAPATSKSKRRRSSQGVMTEESHEVSAAETPSRAGLRSSGRQRRAPQRYGDEAVDSPSGRRNATPGQNGSATSTGKVKYVSDTEGEEEEEEEEEQEEEEEEPSPQPKRRPTRTRSKKATVRFETDDEDVPKKRDESQQSSTPDDYQDGLEDLVSMQLQQDLTNNELTSTDPSTGRGGPLPEYAQKLQSLVQEGLTEELRLLTGMVTEKLNGKRRVPLKGLETEYHKVNHLIEQTVAVGEGNSMLLLGSRGCGKTAIVETIISSLARSHKNDFHVVRLNGFLHTDDRLALREMWRQLGRETNTEDEAGKVSSYADTMATLLALLSHPEELYGPSSDAETATAKSIVIILDEFDLFVTHPRQTLLYNLFDIAQARKAPIAVIGITTKVDVTEMLEKRVKSRFSHRYVYVPLPRSLETFSDICFAGLNLEDGEISEVLDEVDAQEQVILTSDRWTRLLDGWRAYLQGLWIDEAFASHLRRIYHQTKSVKEFFTSALIGLSDLHHSTYPLTSKGMLSLEIPTASTFTSQLLCCPDPAPLPFSASTTASASPSSLPLSLLLAATRLAALYDPGLETMQLQSAAPLALSFPAAYAEYVRLLTTAKTSASVSGAAVTPGRVWGRDVAREAWEKLVSWGLISPVGGGSGTADGRMFRVEISFDEVVELAGTGGSLGRWWRDG
ncbi:putative origin recognition complex subunit Orc4 [Aspergillus sclerotiicarbonarius CBS 121057]|uniref:Origin recognition complex subunit 4 n=1 Tax=Aspergillus sclerotiicarbonarius (strain CBS 121057 / IBT 28362) TaxID=1448318 RepID=A0A319EZX3_ASPSB|nr:putative origin recognition complex subunit Orc4 [Aspergillus sclerotiicarbonarius CBS 121057]